MGEVTDLDKDKHCVFVSDTGRQDVPIPYGYLILATGVTQSYFGHNDFEKYARGLQTLADAVAIQNRILQAFDRAEAEEDPSCHRDLLTLIMAGAGPPGVEMACA